jgi:hypothetical protein
MRIQCIPGFARIGGLRGISPFLGSGEGAMFAGWDDGVSKYLLAKFFFSVLSFLDRDKLDQKFYAGNRNGICAICNLEMKAFSSG